MTTADTAEMRPDLRLRSRHLIGSGRVRGAMRPQCARAEGRVLRPGGWSGCPVIRIGSLGDVLRLMTQVPIDRDIGPWRNHGSRAILIFQNVHYPR